MGGRKQGWGGGHRGERERERVGERKGERDGEGEGEVAERAKHRKMCEWDQGEKVCKRTSDNLIQLC